MSASAFLHWPAWAASGGAGQFWSSPEFIRSKANHTLQACANLNYGLWANLTSMTRHTCILGEQAPLGPGSARARDRRPRSGQNFWHMHIFMIYMILISIRIWTLFPVAWARLVICIYGPFLVGSYCSYLICNFNLDDNEVASSPKVFKEFYI